MSINLHFSTGDLSSEEGVGLRALLDAVQPSLEPAAALRERTAAMYAGERSPGALGTTKPAVVGYDHSDGEDSNVEVSGVKNADGSMTITSIKETPKRERGQPSPGKARRTKAEIAEDEALDAAEAAAVNSTTSVGGAEPVAEDDAETAAQDEADEQAEVDAGRDEEKPVTADDVKNAYLPYFEKYGLEATKEDGAKLFVSVLGDPPAGASGWTTAAIMEQGQDKARKVIEAWAKAAAGDKRFGG